MARSMLIVALLATVALSACDRPGVVHVPAAPDGARDSAAPKDEATPRNDGAGKPRRIGSASRALAAL